MFQPDPDVHRLLSVERAERLRADAVDRPRRRGALRSTTRVARTAAARRHAPACAGDVMTTATETGFSRPLDRGRRRSRRRASERQRVRLRSELGIGAFGVNAVRAVVRRQRRDRPEHDEVGPGADRHEELYLVLAGHAVFTVAGRGSGRAAGHGRLRARSRDPPRRGRQGGRDDRRRDRRSARASRTGSPPGEAMRDFFEPYNAKDYAGALAVARGRAAQVPGQRARALQHRVHGGAPRQGRRRARPSRRGDRGVAPAARERRRPTRTSPRCGATSASRSCSRTRLARDAAAARGS